MNKSYAYALPFMAILLWAGNVIVSKLSASSIAPSAITFYRLVFAILLMGIFLLKPTFQNRKVIKPHLLKLGFLGFLSMALFQSLSYLAAHTTSATNMAILTALIPLLTIVMSALLLKENPTRGMMLGGVISLSGIIYLISHGNPFSILNNGIHIGDLLMLMASLSYALYSVLLKRWDLPVKGWQSTFLQAIAALIFMLPMLLMVPEGKAQINSQTLPLIIYAGGFASILLPYFWIQGIKLVGPNACSMFMNLLPIFTAVIAVSFLGENLTSYHSIGGGLAIFGVIIAQLWRGKNTN